jgi:hypothetical protein
MSDSFEWLQQCRFSISLDALNNIKCLTIQNVVTKNVEISHPSVFFKFLPQDLNPVRMRNRFQKKGWIRIYFQILSENHKMHVAAKKNLLWILYCQVSCVRSPPPPPPVPPPPASTGSARRGTGSHTVPATRGFRCSIQNKRGV